MKIDYSPLPGIEKSKILIPIVPITFFNKKYEFSTFGLVDSGAVSGLISTVIADALQIKWRKIPAKTGYSVSGSFRFHPVSLDGEIYDHRFSLKLNVVEGISAYKCILGQADIFQRAKITFERYKFRRKVKFLVAL